MIYAIGRTEGYEKYFEEEDEPGKLGKCEIDGHPYEGGSVWKTAEGSQSYLDNNGMEDYSVYGVEADWEKDTESNDGFCYNNLLVDSRLFKI